MGIIADLSSTVSYAMAAIGLIFKMTISAVAIVWFGSFAALRRPPSAAPAKSSNSGTTARQELAHAGGFWRLMIKIDNMLARVPQRVEMVMLLSLLPVVAAFTLVLLYQDWNIVSICHRAFILGFSVKILADVFTDGLDTCVGLIFPNRWTDYRGHLYCVGQRTRAQYYKTRDGESWILCRSMHSPFPGWFSTALSPRAGQYVWDLRHYLTTTYFAPAGPLLSGLVGNPIEFKVTKLLGLCLSATLVTAFVATKWRVLSNIMAISLSCSAIRLLSPTSFVSWTLLLGGLMAYDIVMVFYTPLMSHVAAKTMRNLPLVITYTARFGRSDAFVGLGDIAIPGAFVAMALLFDLDQFYRRKIRYIPTVLYSDVAAATQLSARSHYVTMTRRRVKETYVDPFARLGDVFWTTTLMEKVCSPISTLLRTSFPKPYFHCALSGYAIGMACALTASFLFQTGQPAMMYIIPAVVGAVWLTAYLRGETHDLVTYDGSGALDTEDVVVDTFVDAHGNVVSRDVDPETVANENDVVAAIIGQN